MIENFEDDKRPNFISDKKLFLEILTSPRNAFQFIIAYRYQKQVTLLLILAGITRTFDRASLKNMGDHFPLWGVIVFCLIIGGLFGWITYYIYSAAISWIGKWLDGKANTDAILRVLAYALIPSIFSLALLIPQIIVYGNELFQSDGDIIGRGIVSNIIGYSCMLLELILGIWSVILCVIGISEVQKFSIGKSILNLVLPALVIMIPIFSIALLFS